MTFGSAGPDSVYWGFLNVAQSPAQKDTEEGGQLLSLDIEV